MNIHRLSAAAFIIVYAGIPSMAQKRLAQPTAIRLDDLENQYSQNVKTEIVTYKGRKALRVTDAAPVDVPDGIQLVILNTPDFRDGTIEVQIAGKPKEGSESGTPRGFVGVAFRLNMDATKKPHYECFYIRPTNGRAEDQVRRNHATQYISYPDKPWYALRKAFPGKYESYADMVSGEWIRMRIEVHDQSAALYLDGASQPALIVNDLIQKRGKIALWVGTETVAHFSNLSVKPAQDTSSRIQSGTTD